MGLAGELLERAARATPATVEDHSTGWWLRLTNSRKWWSGAVLAHGAADRLIERIGAAERFYAAHGGIARFQICVDCPGRLEQSLAERDYRWQAPISLLTADAAALPAAHSTAGTTVRVDSSLGPDRLSGAERDERPRDGRPARDVPGQEHSSVDQLPVIGRAVKAPG